MTMHPGPSPEEEYGLEAVAQHNAVFDPQAYQQDAKGLGIFHEGYTPAAYQEESHYVHNPPTPRSNTDDGVRTRSGRSTRRTESPFSSSKSRVSKSPMPKSKKDKKSKLDKAKTPKLTAPLSVLTKDMNVPVRDIGAWVNRPAEERRQEVEKRNGYVTRPMNSFMLYRSAYAERTKQWCLQNNHQVVSSVSGESWPMEPQEVRDQFNEWAKIERANHQAAHPEYKFSPSKATAKRRKGEFSDDEEESVELNDPDAEYRGPRNMYKRRAVPRDSSYLASNDVFASHHPYFSQQAGVYGSPEYRPVQPARPLPSNIAYDHYGRPYDPHTHHYLPQQSHQFQYGHEQQLPRVPTPASLTGGSSLGGFGMPSSSNNDDFFSSSRTATPMQGYDQYGRTVYYHQPAHASYQHLQYSQLQPQAYTEHQQYLHSQMQPQHALDPTLEAALADVNAAAAAAGSQESHFENALGDIGAAELAGLPMEYYDQHTSPNATLAPHWSPTDELRKSEF